MNTWSVAWRSTCSRNRKRAPRSDSMTRRWVRLVSTIRPKVSGRSDWRAKYRMACGWPFSASEKSSLSRLRMISPFLVRTVARTLTTLTSVLNVTSSWARSPAAVYNREAAEMPNSRLVCNEVRIYRCSWTTVGYLFDPNSLDVHELADPKG